MLQNNLESFYLKLPVWFQNVACNIKGWQIKRTHLGAGFNTYLEDAEKRTFWPEYKIIEFRNRKLQDFLSHCARTVPYYRELFSKIKFDPNQVKNLEDLKYLPILKKSFVQNHYRCLQSNDIPKKQRINVHTSGTTGSGLRFYTTLDAVQQQWAIWWRYRRWHGIQLDTWCAYFGGRTIVPISQRQPPFWRYNLPGRQILFSGYHLGPNTIKYYVDELRKRKPPWLHGYPSLLALLASHLIDEKTDIGYQPRWITIGSENLLSQQIEAIKRAFGITPIQHYGMAEAAANFSQCENGMLHIDEDFAAVEFIPHNQFTYKVVGTNFTNLATPLVRYEIGDVAALGESTCSCGRPGRLVTKIDGRLEDYVILKNGTLLGRMDHIFKDIVNIREAQLYQRKIGEIFVRVVRGKNYSNIDEKMLINEFRKRVGKDTELRIEYINEMVRSEFGKLRFVVSDIKEGKLYQHQEA
jgi:phenylacetate-CoA ligase